MTVDQELQLAEAVAVPLLTSMRVVVDTIQADVRALPNLLMHSDIGFAGARLLVASIDMRVADVCEQCRGGADGLLFNGANLQRARDLASAAEQLGAQAWSKLRETIERRQLLLLDGLRKPASDAEALPDLRDLKEGARRS